jgi:hypothetical protein
MASRLLDGFPLGYLKSQRKYFSSSVLMLLHSKAINSLLSDAGSCLFSLTKSPLPTFLGIQGHGILKEAPMPFQSCVSFLEQITTTKLQENFISTYHSPTLFAKD